MATHDDPATDRPLLLVIATGMRTYREYLLRSISGKFDIHLFHGEEPSWEKDYITGWTVQADTLDGPAMAASAVELNRTKPISGVMCWDEGRIHATAYVAEALGLRNGDPATVWRLRDKGQTRAALDAAGVPQPRSVPVKTLDDALAAGEKVGYPAVLKPRGLGASLGVVKVTGADDLRRMFPFTRDIKAPDPVLYSTDFPMLVEECVEGEEISVDSVIQDGVLTPLFIGRKVVGYPPYAEEIGHFVDAVDPMLTDPTLVTILRDTHRALGVVDGFTHSEFMLTATGPKVIEVNGRVGGDMIPYLGMLATGIDPGLAAASAACGLPADVTPTRQRVGGVRFFYVDHDDTTIGSIAFNESALPATIDRAAAVAQPGAVVSPPPKGTLWGRVAFATAIGSSIDECKQALDTAEAALEIKSA